MSKNKMIQKFVGYVNKNEIQIKQKTIVMLLVNLEELHMIIVIKNQSYPEN